MLSPIRRVQIWLTFLSSVGLIQNFMGAVGLQSARCGGYMDGKGP